MRSRTLHDVSLPKVSVVIPTYGHARFVLSALASVFEQDFKDFEVVVVNDGSPDDTTQVLAPLVEQRKLRYFEQPNSGQAAARNKGIAEARGEYIALLDDDDLWPPDKLRWQCEVLDANANIGIVAGIARVIDGNGCVIHPGFTRLFGDVSHRSLFGGNPITSPGQTLIRASLLKCLSGFDAGIWGVDDWDLFFRASMQTRIVMTDRLALFYRKHAENASRDICRMVTNTFIVVRAQLRHVPSNQVRGVMREVYTATFRYLGIAAITSVIQRFKLGHVRQGFHDGTALVPFFLAGIKDPWILKMELAFLLSKAMAKIRRIFDNRGDSWNPARAVESARARRRGRRCK